MLVQDSLQSAAEHLPDKVALVCDGERLTYATLEAEANRFANALIALGVQRGDRVVIWLPNSVAAVVAIFGTLKAGAVFVVVNPTTKEEKLRYIVNDCAAAVLVAPALAAGTATAVRAAVPSLRALVLTGGESDAGEGIVCWAACSADFPTARPSRRNIDQDVACLVYTSGSTGEPKGVVCGHNNVVFAAGSIIGYLQNTPDDIVINVLPLSFDYGLYQLLMVMRFGGTLVLERSFAYPAAVLERMEAERVTGLPGVPTLFSLLVRMDVSAFDLSALRYITNTAAALAPSRILQIKEKFPHAALISMYGQTECKRTLYLPPEQLDARPWSVGVAIPGTEVWLVDEAGERVGRGGEGELVARGSHVMRGYWGSPELSAERFRPGPTPGERVLYSGDLFRMDEDGFLTFLARKDNIIKSRGEKVAPKEVENVIVALPGVVDAAVVGVPDPVLGQAIKAFVVVDDTDLSARDILRHCRAHLEDFMVPQSVEIRDELPMTGSGKITTAGLV